MARTALGLLVLFGLMGACSSGDSTGGGTDGAAGGTCSSESDCEACLLCALTGPCKAKVDACTASAECLAFRVCMGENDDPATIASCRSEHPEGADLHCDHTECAVYEQCNRLCESSVACPPR